MNSRNKIKILSLLLCGIITIGSIAPQALKVYATSEIDGTKVELVETETAPSEVLKDEENQTVIQTETVEENTNPTESIEDNKESETVFFDWDKSCDDRTGQINGNQFTKPYRGMYKLTLKADVIEELDQDCFIYLEEVNHKGKKIRIDLHPNDNFEKTIYLPEGCYQVVETGVKNCQSLSFRWINVGAKLNDKQKESNITILLNDARTLVKRDDGTWDTGKIAVNATDSNLIYMVENLDGVYANDFGELYYPTNHLGKENTKLVEKEVVVEKNGQEITEIKQIQEIYYDEAGPGYVRAYGSATMSADVVILISKGGVVGQAEFTVSYDGGKTFTGRHYTNSKVSDPNINLTYEFYSLKDTDEFVKGDSFRFKTIESFKVENVSKKENSRITCVGHPGRNHELEITILSSGGRDVSKVKIVDLKGNTETKTYLIPHDGVLILDDDIKIHFENISGYIKGVSYKIIINSHDYKVNYKPLIILGAGIGIIAFIALLWLISKKDKRKDFVVNPYNWKQDESAYKK